MPDRGRSERQQPSLHRKLSRLLRHGRVPDPKLEVNERCYGMPDRACETAPPVEAGSREA
ncbi:MAG TPA: hypothetical protein VMG41_13855 [Gemmatimonadales bacterium]|nr:hypothetical protein [Gemmatimonadales bacterium]